MIQNEFPFLLKELLLEIETLGFKLTLIGGAVRDYLYQGQLGLDLDFEIRSQESVAQKDWEHAYEKILFFFESKKIKYKRFPYLITKVDYAGFSLEFSSPRLEKQIPENKTHHHFVAHLDSNLTYEQSFIRRDLTINAIGLELDLINKNETYIDPFNGINDLKNKTLMCVDPHHFFNDSVRFLRLIRFLIKFDQFEIDQAVSEHLSQFHLSELSIHHFKHEMLKSVPGQFLKKFIELVDLYQLEIPKTFLFWRDIHLSSKVKSTEDILVDVFKVNPQLAKNVSQFFQFPEKKIHELRSFYHSLEKINVISESELKKILENPLPEVLNDPIFKELKNIDDKNYWLNYFSDDLSDLFKGFRQFDKKIVNENELLSIMAPLRSYYPYWKWLYENNA